MLLVLVAMVRDHGHFPTKDKVPVGPPISLTINCKETIF